MFYGFVLAGKTDILSAQGNWTYTVIDKAFVDRETDIVSISDICTIILMVIIHKVAHFAGGHRVVNGF